MDLAAPERTVVPSLDGSVLVTLAALSKATTGRDVARLIEGASRAGVQRVLNRLSDSGLVLVDRGSAGNLHSANRMTLACPAVENMANLRRELFRRLGEVIAAWEVPVATAAIFGSLARGEGGVESDIDLLLVRGDGQGQAEQDAWSDQVDALVADVQAWTGNRLAPYDLTPEELRAHLLNDEPIVASWRREAITIAGRDLGAVLRGAAR